MLAAVGDGSVLIWNTGSWKQEQRLQHPSYVYTGKDHSIGLSTGTQQNPAFQKPLTADGNTAKPNGEIFNYRLGC